MSDYIARAELDRKQKSVYYLIIPVSVKEAGNLLK